MTVKEVEQKLEGKFPITGITVSQTYAIKLGLGGCVNLTFTNGEFKSVNVNGVCKDKIEKVLGL